jgi:hypothetical protein
MKKLYFTFTICLSFLFLPSYSVAQETIALFEWLFVPSHAASTYQPNNQLILQKTLLKQFTLKHNPNDYSVEFSPNSKIKDIPLQNASLKIQVYYYGNPNGLQMITTDENQQFTMPEFKDSKFVAIDVLSINDQEKYHAICSGAVTPQHNTIIINCKPSTA